MDSLLNKNRPPVFCPGCAHDRITQALDKGFQLLNLSGHQIAIVSDIGCSGLFDTFFLTHAFHGLHGRALTYAAGIKLARPDLNVVVTMGDGGQGIGGAHLLAASRRNLNLTLLILNNFNFGMTGGQFSATTPSEAHVGSGFLNRLERPLDVCSVARSAGAAYVRRLSSYQKDLAEEISKAIEYKGFSVLDIWGICPGRYTRSNKLSPKDITEILNQLPPEKGEVSENRRQEYGSHYRRTAKDIKQAAPPVTVEKNFDAPQSGRHDILLLGNAGQRIITAGEILCLAGLTAGLYATQKNEYNITVLRGPSISEMILSEDQIDYAGIDIPNVIIALSQEGVDRRKPLFSRLKSRTQVFQVPGVNLPSTQAEVCVVDFKKYGVKSQDWAIAALASLAKQNRVISTEMLTAALSIRFRGDVLHSVLKILNQVTSK